MGRVEQGSLDSDGALLPSQEPRHHRRSEEDEGLVERSRQPTVPHSAGACMSRSVAILVPARDTVMTSFAYDLARAMSYHTATTDDRVILYTSHGTLIASQRTEI